MHLLIVGCGFIGSTIAMAADELEEVESISLMDNNHEKALNLASAIGKASIVKDFNDALDSANLVVEAASHIAARSIIPEAIGRGKDCMVMSVGVFADDDFRISMFQKSKEKGSRIYIPSGAVCGTDGLRAASISDIEEVELITTKGPESMAGVPYLFQEGLDVNAIENTTVVFQGSAREAVIAFPRNVNVAATISLLGLGFDRTKVTVIIDPKSKSNSHELIVRGRFGEMHCETKNMQSPANPATSYLAGLSAVSALRRIVRNEWIGV